ncbi:ArsR/SmtB family transcription factor [Streptomyces sp. NPDC002701]|uniref:ArsR/SmtB family transcription factor n=1 Tax=Streptomyces sp. NPDC002701 TaxID=3364661 RepID=UPI0036BB7F65
MMRVHFTARDVARLRIADSPDPLWEVANSYQMLMSRGDPLVFGQWRRRVRPRLAPEGRRLLTALLPPRGYSPDFLTPDSGGYTDIGSAVETVLRTPRSTLRVDLATLAASPALRQPPATELRVLAQGKSDALHRLGTALHGYYRRALAEFWPHLCAQVSADCALRGRAALAGGVEGLLKSFEPIMRWRPPVLEIEYPVDRDLRLDGRGLLLQPSFFCSRRPVMLATPSPGRTPVLAYPIQHLLGWSQKTGAASADGSLGDLMGRTRAAILEDVVSGRTTGELAKRLGVSGSAVSQHTAVLRRAGLLLSVRRRKYVLHIATSAGLALLGGASQVPVHAPAHALVHVQAPVQVRAPVHRTDSV